MLVKKLKQLKKFSHSRWYWGSVLASVVFLIAAALVYQYVLDERPCLLCIQIRLWVSLLIIVSFVGLLVRRNQLMNSAVHTSIVLIAIGLVERCYQLLGTERGFVDGDCGFDLGLPVWFAIEEWLPSVYYVHTACGYTPEIIFGITMAEALMVFSVGLFLVSVFVMLASFLKSSE